MIMYLVKINDYYIQSTKRINKHGQLIHDKDKITTKQDLATRFDLHVAQHLKVEYTKLLNLEIKLIKA